MKTAPVDARPREQGGTSGNSDARVISEWLSGEKRSAGATDEASRREVQEIVQRAKESAERAVDDRVISRRYDTILKRYFDRMPKKVIPASSGVPVLPDADTKPAPAAPKP